MKADINWDILLVDDDEDDYIILLSLFDAMRAVNPQLVWASSFEEGRAKLKERAWDAVLVDYDLGRENGIELIRQASDAGFEAPLIMITGRGRYEVDVEAMEAGADDYLTKDMLNASLLERVIRYSIDHRQTEERLEHMVAERTAAMREALEELQTAEEELRQQNEELLEAQIHLAAANKTNHRLPVAHCLTDFQGKIMEVSQGATFLFHQDVGDLVGQYLVFLVHPSQRRHFSGHLFALQTKDEPLQWFMQVKPRYQEAFNCCWTVTSLKEDGEERLQWLIHPVAQ